MSEIAALAPQKVWYFFDLICSIPHISKHEKALAAKLAGIARDAGLEVICDAAGNVIIHREAAPGFENYPRIIMQAHMDMVPASEKEFDFINTPITPVIDGEWVHAMGTTLGSDDGIGVAHAMAVITDKDFKCGALTVLLTADEEAGMSGAKNLDPTHLAGKYMLNLDGSDHGFCIACAGGLRQEFTFTPKTAPAPEGKAVKITISGLPGGHSGLCIHEDRGNALKFLADFLDQNPEIKVFSFDGGSADNAIPSAAEAKAVTTLSTAEVQKLLDAYTILVKKDCAGAKDMSFAVCETDKAATVWSDTFQTEVLSALALAPHGAMDFDETLNIVKTSSNLATIRTLADKVVIRTSQRSLDDKCRDEIAARIRTHFEIFNAETTPGDIYPATPPKNDAKLLQIAVECAEKFNRKNTAYAVHAGLETGWFSMKNPDLEIISCGPDHHDYHTPYERLNIPSVGKFDTFLRELLLVLGRA